MAHELGRQILQSRREPSGYVQDRPWPTGVTEVQLKTIGVLGGSSDQATAEYYRRINKAVNERLGGWNTAEIIISSMNFALSERWVRGQLWDEAAEYLANKAMMLERAGAGVLICVSNTLHKVSASFTAPLTIPFIHIVDPTGRAVCATGMKRVALIGTKPVMAHTFMQERYRDRFSVDVLSPHGYEQDEIDHIIFDELCKGRITASANRTCVEIIGRLHERGAEGIILGCTELPLLVSQEDCSFVPLFDTMGLHVEATVCAALGE
jgi:aspartate racemase